MAQKGRGSVEGSAKEAGVADGRATEGVRIAAVLLAAGASRRFGPENKLLADIGGEPLVARVARVLLASRACEVVAVAPADPGAIAAALAGLGGAHLGGAHTGRLRIAVNAEPERGIASSIRTGIEAMRPDVSGAMIVPGDMPGLNPSACDALVAAFEASGAIVHAATEDGGQRNPVIWPRRLFAALVALEGDAGGKRLIGSERAARPDAVVAVRFAAEEMFLDVDVPGDLRRWR